MNTLREAVEQYLSMRRNLGFKLREDGARLFDFVNFMEQHRAYYITHRLALDWAQQSSVRPSEWPRRLGFVRVFARYRSVSDPRTQIPPNGVLPYKRALARPYIYSEDEIKSLLRAALKLNSRNELRPWTYYCLFGLLSVSGLRLGEACNLELQDVDLKAAVLTVRRAKFGKSRLVPLHVSTREVLTDYIARRKRFAAIRPVSSYLFVSDCGKRLHQSVIHNTFRALSQKIGLRGQSDSHGPRLHDFRFRFALKTLLRWYRAGEDAERRLPILSTYLGHVKVSHTYWYLHCWPELMREAMIRLQRRWEDVP